MKKIAVLLLTIFTMSTAAICGCASSQENSKPDYQEENTESIQLLEVENENEQDTPDCPDKPECPDMKKHGNRHPHSHKPHVRPDEKLPDTNPTLRKHR